MKHVFFIHSHTMFLTAMGVIKHLNLNDNDVLFLFYRNYSTKIPFRYKVIDCTNEVEKGFYLSFSWSRKNFFVNKELRNEIVSKFDEIVDKNAKEGYFLYVPTLQTIAYQILATNSKCEKCFFFQEGGRIMTPIVTDKMGIVWRIYNKLFLRKETRFWKCLNWFPNKHTPYNKDIIAYAFDKNYFCGVPKETIVIKWPKFDVDINIDPSYPIFLLEGAVELGQCEKVIYVDGFKKLVNQFAGPRNYIKFHTIQSNEIKELYMNIFKEKGLEIEQLPMDIPFELVLAKYQRLKLCGFGTSLLFYGKAMGHEVHSRESYLLKSPRYRMYCKGLSKLREE